MIGILIILGVSWLLLHYFEKENLGVLGFRPVKNGLQQFIIGLSFIIFLKLLFILIETQVNGISWSLNQSFDYRSLFGSFWYHLKSALTEDLIFRAALLYLLIKRLGMYRAIFLSAVAFGVYHWFSYGLLGSRIIVLLYVLLTTGFTGYVWGYTYAKTKSILMPLGFHLGWNFINTLFYDTQPYGQLLFQETGNMALLEPYQTYFSLFIGFAPSIITLIFVKSVLKIPSINNLFNSA